MLTAWPFWFLDVITFCEHGKFVTSVYGKSTFSGVVTYYETLHTLLTGVLAYVVISRHLIWKWVFENQPHEKQLSSNFNDLCIKSILNKLYTPKVTVQNISKRNISVKLPFLGSTSLQIQLMLQKLFTDKSTSCNLKVVLTYPLESKDFSPSRISYLKMLVSGLVYKHKCGGCNTTYRYYMRRPNAILRSEFVRTFSHVTSRWKKGKTWQ